MSQAQTTPRLVPTLTEVLEASDLQSPASDRPALDRTPPVKPGYLAELDFDLTSDLSAKSQTDDNLEQIVLATVETALAEFRLQLLARLEPLFENRGPPRSN